MAVTTTRSNAAVETREIEQTRVARKVLRYVPIYLLLVLISAIIVMPLLWMLSTSFKPKSQWFTQSIEWVPRTFTLENYQKLFSNPATPIGSWFLNSVL